MADAITITLWDIATRPPRGETCPSPNPWKSRFALNFKNLPSTTTWVPLPNVAKVRQSLGLEPVRRFADGSGFYTLPIIRDPSTDKLVGDSFDIAVYLNKTYPTSGGGDLFPPETPLDYEFKPDFDLLVPLSKVPEGCLFPEYAKFQVNVDGVFTAHTQLTPMGFPFDPETEEASKQVFMGRAGVTSFDAFALVGEAREKTMQTFEKSLAPLAELYRRNGGPFLLGEKATYADFIVGGWLMMFSRTLPAEEWKTIKGWHGGEMGRLFDALQAFAKVN